MKKYISRFFAMVALILAACGGEQFAGGDIPTGQLPRIEQPQFPRCLARKYSRTDIGPATQVTVIPTDNGWLMATSPATPYRDEPVRIHRFGGPSSGEDERSVVNAGLGQFALSGYDNNLLLSGYGHREGELPKPVVEVLSLDSGKQISLESWQPGVVSTDPFGGGYVYGSTYTRESGMWARLGSVESDGVQTIIFDTRVGAQIQCAFSGGVAANLSGDIAAMVVTGDFVSRKYEILFLIYSRQSGRWSRTTLGSYDAPEIARRECRPEAAVRPLGIFATAAGGWQVFWVDANGLKLADINGHAVTQQQVTIDLPPGTSVLAPAVQVPNGYLLALRGAPTERLAATVGAALVRSTGEVAAYQPFTFGEVVVPRIEQLYQAGTAALAAAKKGRTAALAYVAEGGQARVLFFSNDCD